MTIKSFAKQLQISEPTLKRWFKGKGLSLRDWIRMIDLLDLSMDQVISQASPRSIPQLEYTRKQEEALGEHKGLLAFFQQLHQRKKIAKIANEYSLTMKSTAFYLRKLDEIGLIRWMDGLEYELISEGEPIWRKGGPLSKKFRNQAINGLIHNNLENGKLKLAIYEIDSSAAADIEAKLQEILGMAKQSEKRSRLGGDRTKSYGLSYIITEYSPDFLSDIPNV